MGQVLSGGDSRQATAEELQAVATMRQALSQLPVPTLQHRDNPHEYLFFALSDGSGQDLNNPKLGPPTNVGVLYKQAQALEDDPSLRIATHYTKGIGAQSNGVVRTIDGMVASTWDDGIEKMYREFAKQSEKWLRQDPQAQIRVAGVGYSRGAVQDVGFHRLVDQYGIANPEGLKFGRDRHGNITIESSRPPLVPPGQVAQVAPFFDPVATNMPRNYDARIPGSLISSFSLLATNEQREWYPHQAINDLGMTPDGRALTAPVPGGHANAGGGAREPGLEILYGNAVIDYLNLLRDEPMFEKRPVPTDPAMFTVYQVRGVTAGFGMKMDRDGERNLREELANCKVVNPCRDAEPMDRDLAAKFEYRHVQIDPLEQKQLQALIEQARFEQARSSRTRDTVQIGTSREPHEPALPGLMLQPANPQLQSVFEVDRLFDKVFSAYTSDNTQTFRAVMADYRQSDHGQAWGQQQQAFSQSMREQEQHDALQQQAALGEQQRQEQVQRGPVMSR